MITRKTTVVNETGLHARPASDFVLKAKSFESKITIRETESSDEPVNAKSIIRLLSIGTVGDAAEAGVAEGEPLAAAASQRDALSALLWSGREALPVVGADGAPIGRVTLAGLARRAARPQ